MNYRKYNIKNFVNIKEMCNKAYQNKYAIGQYNINNCDWAKAILETAEKMKSPVILGVSKGALTYIGGFKTVVGIVTGLIVDLKITVPVALHLDHSTSFEQCKLAIENGFSSVMFDGSSLPIEENLAITRKVVELAHKHDVSVEGEVGIVGGVEDDIQGQGVVYAKLPDIISLSNTGVDVVAASLGSVHGKYKTKPRIGFKEIAEASHAIKKPLVLHGGSGLSDETFLKAISLGEAKINVNTEGQIAFSQCLAKYFADHLEAQEAGYDPRKIDGCGIKLGLKPTIEQYMKLFNSKNKA